MMRIYSDPEYQSTRTIQNVLFVPGIEHDNRDLTALRESVRDRIRLITVEKNDVPFDQKRRKEWEAHFRAHLLNTAKENHVSGLVGHSFGCFRAVSLLQEGLHVDFVSLLNPPLNTIGTGADNPDCAYRKLFGSKHRITDTRTEDRLLPLLLELDGAQYDEFIMNHTEYERLTGEQFQPTQIAEFKALSASPDFPSVLRSAMKDLGYPSVPVTVYRSLCDQWNIQKWDGMPPNVSFKEYNNAGHYLHVKYASEIGQDLVAAASSLELKPLHPEEVLREVAVDIHAEEPFQVGLEKVVLSQ